MSMPPPSTTLPTSLLLRPLITIYPLSIACTNSFSASPTGPDSKASTQGWPYSSASRDGLPRAPPYCSYCRILPNRAIFLGWGGKGGGRRARQGRDQPFPDGTGNEWKLHT